MPRGIYIRTSEMRTGKCESIEKRIEIAKESWKSENIRQKRILRMKSAWENGKLEGRQAWNKGIKTGITQSEETKEKRKKTWLEKYGCFPNQRIAYRKRLSEEMKAGRAAYLNSFIKNPSKSQIKLYDKIKKLREDSVLNYPCLSYSIDIAIPSLKIAIEYDGSYWHKDEERDKKRQSEIESNGWKFFRYKDYIPSNKQLERDLCGL
jgi:hypothetical protein